MSTKRNLFIMQAQQGEHLSYSPEELLDALRNAREFIVSTMASELSADSMITAKELAMALMPLDYLVNDVEYRTLDQRGGQQ